MYARPLLKQRKDGSKINPDSGESLPIRRAGSIGAPGGNFPLVAYPRTHQTQVQRVTAEITPQALEQPVIERAPMGEIRAAEAETHDAVDVEKIADMVYHMLRQDLIVEMERLSVLRRLI